MYRIFLVIAAFFIASTTAQADDQRIERQDRPDREMRERMQHADRDGDKQLSKEEAKSMPHLDKHFDALDKNADGQVSKDEMRAEKKSKKDKREQRAADKYKHADENHDGQISRDEAKTGMPRIAKDFDTIDANKDGNASKDEINSFHQERMQKLRDKKRPQ